MNIYYHCLSHSTIIEAELEDSDTLISRRVEGSGTSITLRTPLIYFDKAYPDLHPDIIGLVSLVLFYPFIGGPVTLPKAVSPALAATFSRPIFRKEKILHIRNIDPNLKGYVGESPGVIAFGGGVDSSAIRALFPNMMVVHEASIRRGEILPDRTREIWPQQSILTNSRYVSNPGGWHTWASSIVTALLEAGAKQATHIYAGTILGTAFLGSGVRYRDRHQAVKHHGISGNYWNQAFWDIGLPLVTPLMGCSEILTMQASLTHLSPEELIYCTANNGSPCHACMKCLRRQAIEEYLTGHRRSYTAYDSPQIHRALSSRPMHMGHIYATLITHGWQPPEYLKKYFEDLPRISFPLYVYMPSVDFAPAFLQEELRSVLQTAFVEMNPEHIQEFKAWGSINE